MKRVQIRSLHHYAFRSGQWANILNVEWVEHPLGGRACYSVQFPDDGTIDQWPIIDPVAGYEFRERLF